MLKLLKKFGMKQDQQTCFHFVVNQGNKTGCNNLVLLDKNFFKAECKTALIDGSRKLRNIK